MSLKTSTTEELLTIKAHTIPADLLQWLNARGYVGVLVDGSTFTLRFDDGSSTQAVTNAVHPLVYFIRPADSPSTPSCMAVEGNVLRYNRETKLIDIIAR